MTQHEILSVGGLLCGGTKAAAVLSLRQAEPSTQEQCCSNSTPARSIDLPQAKPWLTQLSSRMTPGASLGRGISCEVRAAHCRDAKAGGPCKDGSCRLAGQRQEGSKELSSSLYGHFASNAGCEEIDKLSAQLSEVQKDPEMHGCFCAICI